MKIRRFLSSVIVADGGTTVCRIEMADGSEMFVGLDARIPKLKKDRLLFVGADYPTKPGAHALAIGSIEERKVIDALQDYLSREAANADPAAMDLISALRERESPLNKSATANALDLT